MRVSGYDTAELERQLGPRGSLVVGSGVGGNRELVQNWLLSQGYPSSWVKRIKLSTLGKAYNRPSFLAWCDANRERLANGTAEEDGPAGEGVSVPSRPAPMLPGDTGAQLAALIARIAARGCNESRVLELIAEHVARPEVEYRDRIIVRDNGAERILPDEARHAVFADVLAAAVCGLNVYLVGPAGCGKTELAAQVARACGARFGHTGAVGSKYDLSGYRDAHGNYVSNCELPDFYENGGHFLFDEIDGSVPNAVLFLNTALANGRCAFPHRVIKRHPGFFAIAAANTYGNGASLEYVGRNPLDAASKDRFIVIHMDYDEKLERLLYGDTEWTGYVQKARRAIRELKVRHVVSMRATAQGRALLEAGMGRDKVETCCLWKGLEPDQVSKIKLQMGS